QAVAARLDHLAALAVAAGAGEADAGLGHLALAQAHREVAAADHHAVEHHAAATHPAGHHRAQVLHHAARHFVVADAGHLHAALALLELHGAARHHHVVGAGRPRRRAAHRRSAHRRNAHARHPHSGTLHHHRAVHSVAPSSSLANVFRPESRSIFVRIARPSGRRTTDYRRRAVPNATVLRPRFGGTARSGGTGHRGGG